MDSSLDHVELTPEDASRISAKMASQSKATWMARTAAGQHLEWAIDTFAIKQAGSNKKTKETRMHVCWHDKDGKKLDFDDGFPSVSIVGPVAPVAQIFVTMEAAAKYDEGSAKNVIQKVVLDTDDRRCPDWAAYIDDMDSLFNKKRIEFMVDHITEHEYLSESHRKFFKKHGRNKTIEKLLEDLDDSTAIGHRKCAWSKAKCRVFKPRRTECDGMISPFDRRTLDSAAPDGEKPFDVGGRIEAYLEKGYTGDNQKKAYELKLLPITKRNGDTVAPHELGHLQPKGMYASLTLVCNGVHVRTDGGAMQHSVTLSNTHVQLCNNGLPSEHKHGMSIDDMMGADGPDNGNAGIDIGAVMRDAN